MILRVMLDIHVVVSSSRSMLESDVIVCGDSSGGWIVGQAEMMEDKNFSRKAIDVLESYDISIGLKNVTVRRFRNPAGYVFDTVVFREINQHIPGHQEQTRHTENSWFEGFAWSALSCGREHLGWRFTSSTNTPFYLVVLSQIQYVDTNKWMYEWNPTTRSFVSGGRTRSSSTRSATSIPRPHGSKWREL